MRTDWILDIIIGIAAIFLFALMMLYLPTVMPPALGYLTAFLIFVVFLTIMGLTVVKRSVGESPVKKAKK